MKKIAVTCEQEYVSNPQKFRSLINTDYVEFVIEAGASPFIVCPGMNVLEIAEMMDGLLLSGGKDINPLMYGEDLHSSGAGNSNLIRDRFEKKLYKAFVALGKPIFGICRGFQLIGILNGFSLVQEINKYKDVVLVHQQGTREIAGTDPVHVMANRGIFNELMGKVIPINSFHHQGFLLKGQTSKTSWIRTDPDVLGWSRSNEVAKVMEAFMARVPSVPGEPSDTLIGGVQYHPERMIRGVQHKNKHLAPFRYVMGMMPEEFYDVAIEEDDQRIEVEEEAVENATAASD